MAGSDFQSPNGHGQSSANVSAILTAIRQKYPSAYGLLFAGDYDYGYNTSEQGKDIKPFNKMLELIKLYDGLRIYKLN